MKSVYILIALMCFPLWLWAQAEIKKPDLIFRNNQTILEVEVDSIDTYLVYYHLFGKPDLPVRKSSLKDVAKIRYADGHEEFFNQAPVQVAKSAKPEKEREQSKPAAAPPVRKEKYTENISNGWGRPLFAVTFAGDGLYMLGNSNWVSDKEKAAFQTGVGGSVGFDLHLAKFLAIALRGGYYKWQVSRDYVENDEILFSAKTALTQIPVHLGLKVYPFKGFYIMPEGGYQLYTFDYQDGSELSEKISGGSLAYGGSLGVEIRGKFLLLDISAKYNVLNIKDLGNGFKGMGPASYAGVRLGVGFIKRK